MPDPTTTTATVATAAAGAAGAAITSAGMAFGVPLPVIVAAVFGATVGVQRLGQLEITVRGLWVVATAFAAALLLGIFGGRVAGWLLEQLIEWAVHKPVPVGIGTDALCALLISWMTHSVIVPSLSRRLGVEIEQRGAGK